MAYRKLGNARDLAKHKDRGRGATERDFDFAGFLVLDCPLKPDSKSVISELRKSRHRVVMITGDALLTAAEVARQVGIIRKTGVGKQVYNVLPKEGTSSKTIDDVLWGYECVPLLPTADQKSLRLSTAAVSQLLAMEKRGEAAFCMTGDVLAQIARDALCVDSGSRLPQLDEKHQLLHPTALSVLASIVPMISVFARHSPHQKEAVLAAFNRAGNTTCMCGDGTNDVGALKRASVGISIVSAPEVEEKQRNASERMKRAKHGTTKPSRGKFDESMRELREAQDMLEYVELGDASVAAPFTSRQVSIKCCKDVIQQGRCTLVSMLSIYKILGVNCLVNALVLSKLFLHGAKQGERQLTELGVAVAALFYFVTRAEPLPTLSPIRPPSSVLCPEALFSIAGQFAVHCAVILLATDAALRFTDPYDPSLVPDGPFNPNPLNTCTYLLTCLASINTFAVNYRGRPFSADLRHNSLLYRTLQGCYVVLFVCAWEAFPPLSDLLQLAPLPSSMAGAASVEDDPVHSFASLPYLPVSLQDMTFPTFLSLLMVIDTLAVFALERFWRRLFEGSDLAS
jgi:manganese-transporting P-type ATPase